MKAPSDAAVRPRLTGETLQFMQRLWVLAHALDVSSKRMARTLGVTGPQRLVVRIVGQNPGTTASLIALTLGIHPSTLTGILARLEDRKLIRRVLDPVDRRRSRFQLTPAGKRIDREHRGTVEAAVRRALARAGKTEVDHTSRMIDALVQELMRA